MSAYREPEAREESPLVDRVRSDEEWRLMKQIASDECKQWRARCRGTALAAAAALVIATCVMAAESPTNAHVAAAWVTVPVVALATAIILLVHSESDDQAGNLAAAKVELQRERSR